MEDGNYLGYGWGDGGACGRAEWGGHGDGALGMPEVMENLDREWGDLPNVTGLGQGQGWAQGFGRESGGGYGDPDIVYAVRGQGTGWGGTRSRGTQHGDDGHTGSGGA